VSAAVVIAVDGTAACGKGTLARLLARHYRFAHLDSGALYRLVARGVIEANGDPANEADAVKAARAIEPAHAIDSRIRSDDVGRAASQVAALPAVRRELLDYQRQFARHPPGNAEGAVIDGRDIGTVIAPDAAAKLFVDARPEVRAHRRWLELRALGIARDEADVLAELNVRDAADRNRPISPLKQAVDAALLDTSDLGIDAAFAAALTLLDHKVKAALAVRHRG
jgi:cytidylate kinase